MTAARRDESGFTLVELLVASTAVAILMAALGAALVIGLRTTDDTNQRLRESHDAQMAASWFVPDVHSAGAVTVSQPTCAASSPVATFEWTDQGAASRATYVLETAGGERRLRRSYTGAGETYDVVVAHNLAPACADATAQDPAVVVGAGCPPLPACAAGAVPTRVSLSLSGASGYRYSVTGERRAR